MRLLVMSLILVSAMFAHATYSQERAPATTNTLIGRWRVKFTFVGGSEKNLVFEARAQGHGSLLLLDTGPNDKPVATPLPAVWSLTNNSLSISSEVELPIGTCCRETGTVIFKGKLSSEDSISGKFIFVTNVEEEESPYKFRTTIGTFNGKRLLRD